MVVAKRLTFVYHAAQDRLRMAVEEEGGKRLALWLTARLTRRLAEFLLGKISSDDSRQRPLNSQLHQDQPVSQGVLQAWEQDLALRGKAQSSDVPVDRETPQILVESVNVRFHARGVELIFLWSGERGKVRLLLSPTELRQWLDLVFRKTCQAGWPLDYWPDWMRRPDDSSVSESTGRPLDKMTLN